MADVREVYLDNIDDQFENTQCVKYVIGYKNEVSRIFVCLTAPCCYVKSRCGAKLISRQ